MRNFKLFLAVLTLTIAFSSASFAQNMSLPSLDGQTVSIDNQKGKVVVLALGASWLPLSTNQAAITNDLSKRFAGKDVAIYFVTTDSASNKSKNFASDAEIKEFVTKSKLNVPVLRDSDGSLLMKNYKITQIPAFVTLDKDGKITGEPFGGITPNSEAQKNLANLISQKIEGLL